MILHMRVSVIQIKTHYLSDGDWSCDATVLAGFNQIRDQLVS